MDAATERLVRQRSKETCEYCRIPQEYDDLPFQIDHIIARKHGGSSKSDNLALACFPCNNSKGPNIAGLDPDDGQITRLFHPRTDEWNEHFAWNGPELVGRTSVGRATIAVLGINRQFRVVLRQALINEGVFPPM
ncbi:MAG: HNH endonuclease [Planctomycetota bacterium]